VLVSVLRSVARRRLVETENRSARATVDCKVWKPAIALHLTVIKRGSKKVLLNPIIRSRTLIFVVGTNLHVTIMYFSAKM
jgi:hypothetical protein